MYSSNRLVIREEVPRPRPKARSVPKYALLPIRRTREPRSPEIPPATDELYARHSRRCSFTIRRSMLNKPVVAIQCEGVIADFVNFSFWTNRRSDLYLAPKLVQGLVTLRQRFQVVLFSGLPRDRLALVILRLRARGMSFDAVYRFRHGRAPCTYEHLSKDFRLTSSEDQLQKLIVSFCTHKKDRLWEHYRSVTRRYRAGSTRVLSRIAERISSRRFPSQKR